MTVTMKGLKALFQIAEPEEKDQLFLHFGEAIYPLRNRLMKMRHWVGEFSVAMSRFPQSVSVV